MWVFRSLQISHIKQASTIFQMIRPWKKKRSNSPWHHPLNSKHQIYIYIMLVYYKCLLNWSLVDYVPSHVYNNYTFYSFNMHIQKISTNCSITYNIYKQKTTTTTTTTKKRKNWLTIHILTTMDLPNKHPMQNSSHTHITHTHMLKSTQDWLSQSPRINC